MELTVGDRVTHENEYHVRGASIGAIESVNLDNRDEIFGYRVWWEEDGEDQIHPFSRTYDRHELKLADPSSNTR
jgi:hypothetical protein